MPIIMRQKTTYFLLLTEAFVGKFWKVPVLKYTILITEELKLTQMSC
jgi:hypothetical protein